MVTMSKQTSKLNALKNRYYVMRHGQSLANVQGLIVSQPENGLNSYGLSETGRQQVKAAIGHGSLDPSTRIICSDFKRTRETAILVHYLLACDQDLELDSRLRERNFGELELGSDDGYAGVWVADQSGGEVEYRAVESVSSVLERSVAVILDLEQQFENQQCLLIAHGDILQILQTAFSDLPAYRHRDLPHLDTAELRLLNDL
ncbi:MAG: broad specificity phosphatase PhoE [Polaribacter sp.]|jgi:broad specificity phosphatase PhoE